MAYRPHPRGAVSALSGADGRTRRAYRGAVVQHELYKWVRREMDNGLALQVIAWTEQSRVVPLSTALALYAADLALEHKLAFADATIYATARQADAPLITADNHFEGLPEVKYFPK